MSDIVLEGQMPRVETLGTREEVEQRVKGLVEEGWRSLPCDDPERGTLGRVVFRDVVSEGEPVKCIGDGVYERQDGSKFRAENCLVTEASKDLPVVPVLEEVYILEWPIHGRVMEPDVAEVGAEELAAMLTADPSAVSCDDPRRRLLGFVWYRVEEGKSIVRRVPLTRFKGADEAMRDVIKAHWDRLKAGAASPV